MAALEFVAVFYTDLGLALAMAGVCFWYFLRLLKLLYGNNFSVFQM